MFYNRENMIKFSVIIPVYKAEKYITTCLDSVINQTYPAYEIIIINDGSPDNSDVVIKSFIESHKGICFHYEYQENQGPAITRGYGISIAKGDYIAFLDADDIWYPKKLETIAKYINDTNGDFFYSDEIEVRLDGSRREIHYGNIEGDPVVYLLVKGNPISTSTCVVETERLKRDHSFLDGCKYCEDMACWLSLLNKGAIAIHVPEVLGEYVRNSESLTNSDTKFMINTGKRIIEFYDMLSEHGFTDDEIKALKQKREVLNEYNLARHYHAKREYKKAVLSYKAVLKKEKNRKALIGMYLAKLHINK